MNKSYREADKKLVSVCSKIYKNKDFSFKTRIAAFFTLIAFKLRIFLKWHSQPNMFAKIITLGFSYGRYGGVGKGLVAGETRDPIDELDIAYRNHDQAYIKE